MSLLTKFDKTHLNQKRSHQDKVHTLVEGWPRFLAHGPTILKGLAPNATRLRPDKTAIGKAIINQQNGVPAHFSRMKCGANPEHEYRPV